MLKWIFNVVGFCALWFVIYALLLSIFAGLGVWDPLGRIGSIPGITGIASIFLSYGVLKPVRRFFTEKAFKKRD